MPTLCSHNLHAKVRPTRATNVPDLYSLKSYISSLPRHIASSSCRSTHLAWLRTPGSKNARSMFARRPVPAFMRSMRSCRQVTPGVHRCGPKITLSSHVLQCVATEELLCSFDYNYFHQTPVGRGFVRGKSTRLLVYFLISHQILSENCKCKKVLLTTA